MDLSNGFKIKLEGELAVLFSNALEVTGDEPGSVLGNMIREYHTRVMSTTKSNITQQDRTKISTEMALVAYEYAKKVYSNELRLTDAKIEVARLTGMNPGSVQDYIMDFKAMMAGKEYARAMKNADSELFIKNIYNDFGEKYFLRAIEATKKHIEYYESKSGTNLSGKREMIAELERKYLLEENDEIIVNDSAFELSTDDITEFKVGKIANEHLRRILESELINKDLLTALQEEEYSKDNFDLQFPLLVKEGVGFDEKRYYKKPLNIRGGVYYMCSQWYETESNNDKKYLLRWLKMIISRQ